MKAMIFAAGMGTRLKPMTDTMPKALVPVEGKPLLRYVIEKLAKSGFDELVINVHHFGDQIIDYLARNHNFGLHIEVSDERGNLLDTGGGIKKAAHFFDDGKPFLVHNVDIFSSADLAGLYQYHLDHHADVTLLSSPRTTTRYLLFDEEERLNGWINTQTGETKSPYPDFKPSRFHQLAFSGIHVISPSVFPLMDSFPEKFPIMDFYLRMADRLRIVACPDAHLELLDVGKLFALNDASLFVKKYGL